MRFKVTEGQGTAPERQSQIAGHDGTDPRLSEGEVRDVTSRGPDKRQNDSAKAHDEEKSKNPITMAAKQAKLDTVEFQYVWKQRHSLASLARMAQFGSHHPNS